MNNEMTLKWKVFIFLLMGLRGEHDSENTGRVELFPEIRFLSQEFYF